MARLAQIVKTDSEIQVVRDELEELPIKVREIEEQLQTLDSEYLQKKSEWEKAEAEIKKLKSEIEVETQHLKNREERIHAIKTQKEYVAALKEISMGKTAIKEREDKIKSLSQSSEELAKVVSPLEESRTGLLNSLEQERSAIQGNLDTLRAKLQTMEAQFNEQLLALPEDIRHKYRRIGEKRQPAAARVVKGTCQECFMNLPPQLFIEIQKHKEVYSCPNCHRLLFIE